MMVCCTALGADRLGPSRRPSQAHVARGKSSVGSHLTRPETRTKESHACLRSTGEQALRRKEADWWDPRLRGSKWAIFGKQNWRCGMNRKPGYGVQLRVNLEPTKGVGRLRQQDGGHGS
ncbi:hypothetical protein HPP92_007078 [Vanilla planifolia]|uniref:Uncharacterized protein n=1 Tax=Vanilla planifolia TaxID=51239 RepID=A0A835RLP3_VANPL|nr:hypothetical protein HPP92_007078 [Vanilla planifolia]